MFNATGDVDRIRGLVVRGDQVSGSTRCGAGDAAAVLCTTWVCNWVDASGGRSIDCLKRRRPSGLRQIIGVYAEAGPQYGLPAVAGRKRQTQPGSNLHAVIVRRDRDKRNIKRSESDVGRIV